MRLTRGLVKEILSTSWLYILTAFLQTATTALVYPAATSLVRPARPNGSDWHEIYFVQVIEYLHYILPLASMKTKRYFNSGDLFLVVQRLQLFGDCGGGSGPVAAWDHRQQPGHPLPPWTPSNALCPHHHAVQPGPHGTRAAGIKTGFVFPHHKLNKKKERCPNLVDLSSRRSFLIPTGSSSA